MWPVEWCHCHDAEWPWKSLRLFKNLLKSHRPASENIAHRRRTNGKSHITIIWTVVTQYRRRNVGDCAYAMSHAAVEACTVLTAAGCRAWHWRVSGDGYLACSSNIYNGRALDGPTLRRVGLAAKPLVFYDARWTCATVCSMHEIINDLANDEAA